MARKRVVIEIDLDEEEHTPTRLCQALERLSRVVVDEPERMGGTIKKEVPPYSQYIRLTEVDDSTYVEIGAWRMEVGDVERMRHLGRDSVYDVLHNAVLQTDKPLADNASLVVYRGEDGKWWARAPLEFYHPDRFVPED